MQIPEKITLEKSNFGNISHLSSPNLSHILENVTFWKNTLENQISEKLDICQD